MPGRLSPRSWLPGAGQALSDEVSEQIAGRVPAAVLDEIDALVGANREIHDVRCVNLNPATNVMNPRAEALLAAGLGTRPSLGPPGDKYEMGLEAIERIELVTAELAAELFDVDHVEVRAPSGAIANLVAFMATCRPGDTIVAPPAEIAGHVTHHSPGAAGLYGLDVVAAPVDVDRYTVDVDGLASLARRARPALITLGASLNLFPHPVATVREIADEVGAKVLFDAAHACGMIAGRAWASPLAEGAHLMTMSTYKSLGGPPGGLVLTNDAELAERVEAITYPGLTANFDAGVTAALAVTLVDWLAVGADYAEAMRRNAARLAAELTDRGVRVFAADRGTTTTHQFAIEAARYGGGQTAARRLRRAGILTSGIGLPLDPVDGDVNGLRLGTPEVTRLGMRPDDMALLADFVARGLDDIEDPAPVADEVARWRSGFEGVHFTA